MTFHETFDAGKFSKKLSSFGFFNIFRFLSFYRYIRHLDTTVHAIHIKTKFCQLVETMMARRDHLAFRQEMKFRNKLVMGNSHQIAPPSSGDVSLITR